MKRKKNLWNTYDMQRKLKIFEISQILYLKNEKSLLKLHSSVYENFTFLTSFHLIVFPSFFPVFKKNVRKNFHDFQVKDC